MMRKKLYSLVLMAVGLLISTQGWAAERTAGTFSDLQNALTNASNGDVIKLTADIAYTTNGSGLINITKSITLDGDGHTISGWGNRSNNRTTIAINNGGSNMVSVTFQNLTIVNAASAGRAIETRGKITSFTLDNCEIKCTGGGNTQPLTIGGSQSSIATLHITNSYLYAGSGGYPLISFNPFNLTTENTIYEGYCAMYFKGNSSSAGSAGTIVNATNCIFECPNVNSGETDCFGVFVCSDGGINVTLNDCGMNSRAIGSATQEMFNLRLEDNVGVYRTSNEPCNLTINGNNSHLNGSIFGIYFSVDPAEHLKNYYSISITGGTYSVDPSKVRDPGHPEDLTTHNFVPEGYEVSEVSQYVEGKDPVTLYRVHPKAAKDEDGVAYKLNDDVETKGGGQNPNTSFILSADETVAAEKTYAEYVEVNAGKITIPTGKALNVGEAGLVVKDGAQIVVEAGGVLTVSKGGAITAKDESIIVGADAINGAGSYLVDPVVTFNTKPLATVKMVANVGKSGNDYTWHRFAMPVEKLETPWTKVPDYGTLLYEWSYSKGDWDQTAGGSTGMKPFLGYTITTQKPVTDVEYTFKGNLLGNSPSEIDFQQLGYGYFGNSYTGYILAKEMLKGFKDVEGIEGQVWMWNAAQQSYSGVSLKDLWEHEDRLAAYEKEVAPMQTFILKTNSGDGANINIDYMKAIWGNPRYGLVEEPKEPTPAPARYNAADVDNAFAKIVITAANGQSDGVRLTENDANEDAYENSIDATKYFNENKINVFVPVEGENYTSLYTNNLLDKEITLQTQNEVAYTLSVGYAEGDKYALQDMLTGTIIPLEQGTTYNFAAQSNTTSKRFRVVEARKVVTNIDNVEASRSAKGIYTVLGQYVGETSMFNALPTGVYVIDGVKIIK